jgi:hexosaminidase
MLKEKLVALQEQYEDTDPQKYLPVQAEELEHLAKGLDYTLKYPASERYPGKPGGLTDGISYPEGEAYNIGLEGWCGFRENDLLIELDLGRAYKIKSIKAGFMQNQTNWIFFPQELEFHTSLDGSDYMIIPVSLCGEIEEDKEVKKVSARAEYPDEEVRYIKILAKNILIPDWHPGAGKPAWLFIDEVVVLD